jgi:hypothetical protein
MNTRSAREYITFAPSQLLSNKHEQRPRNRDDLDSSVTGENIAGRDAIIHRSRVDPCGVQTSLMQCGDSTEHAGGRKTS